jgi:hypothetical protein
MLTISKEGDPQKRTFQEPEAVDTDVSRSRKYQMMAYGARRARSNAVPPLLIRKRGKERRSKSGVSSHVRFGILSFRSVFSTIRLESSTYSSLKENSTVCCIVTATWNSWTRLFSRLAAIVVTPYLGVGQVSMPLPSASPNPTRPTKRRR